MRENTFDIPAIKFCIAFDASERKAKHFDVSEKGVRFIPFKDVDGLLVEEVIKIVGTDNFTFVALADTKSINGEHRYTHLLAVETFDGVFLQTQSKERIDKVIEKQLEGKYDDVSSQQQRIYQCFFERYQGRSYDATLKRVSFIKSLKTGK